MVPTFVREEENSAIKLGHIAEEGKGITGITIPVSATRKVVALTGIVIKGVIKQLKMHTRQETSTCKY